MNAPDENPSDVLPDGFDPSRFVSDDHLRYHAELLKRTVRGEALQIHVLSNLGLYTTALEECLAWRAMLRGAKAAAKTE